MGFVSFGIHGNACLLALTNPSLIQAIKAIYLYKQNIIIIYLYAVHKVQMARGDFFEALGSLDHGVSG